MAAYASCSACQGIGSFKCPDCACPRCNATGSVEDSCPKCHGAAKVTCETCRGEGRVLTKKGFFSDKYAQCWKCKGSRQQDCTCRAGKVVVRCPSCNEGRSPQCPHCGSTGQLKCSTCNGSGKVKSRWFTSLANMTVEQLKFERNTRNDAIASDRDEIQGIRSEISDMRSQLKELEDYWQEQMEARSYFTKIEGGAPVGLEGIPRAIRRLESDAETINNKIRNAKAEVAAIDEVIRVKLAGT